MERARVVQATLRGGSVPISLGSLVLCAKKDALLGFTRVRVLVSCLNDMGRLGNEHFSRHHLICQFYAYIACDNLQLSYYCT